MMNAGRRRDYLRATGALVAGGLAGCASEQAATESDGTGSDGGSTSGPSGDATQSVDLESITPNEIGIGASPSSDATWLWNGEDATLDQWVSANGGPAEWTENEDYFAVNYGTGNIETKEAIGDCHLHQEYRAPEDVEGQGQSRSNSGLFMMREYEFQILMTYDNPTYGDGYAGAYYSQAPPLANSLRPPGEWNAYDLFWRAPRFEDGELVRPAQATLLINGVVVQAHLDVDGPNYGGVSPYEPHPPEAPIVLQDHNDFSPPEFRNVWYRPLADDPVEEGDADPPLYETSSGNGRPPQVEPTGPATDGAPPEDATELFDGGLSGWEHVDGGDPEWSAEDGTVEVAPGSGDVQTAEGFGDSQVHLEWRIPEGVEGEGLDRGNSGLLMMGQYQVQLLDNDGNAVDPVQWAGSYPDQAPPAVSAVKAQGEWQSLDVIWQGPRFDGGSLEKPAQVTVLLNETVVQSRLVPEGPNPDGTVGSYEPHDREAPIRLEEHGSPVQFRNAWQRDLESADGSTSTTVEGEPTVTKRKVASATNGMKLDVAPDGRVFYTTRGQQFSRYPDDPEGTARIYVYDPETEERTTALERDVFTGVEMGGQGIQLDPNFADNGWLYFFYSPSNEALAENDAELEELNTFKQDPSDVTVDAYNVVSRFTVEDGTIDPDSETEIIRIPGSRERCCHVGGALEFDADGNLLITTGDDTDPFESSGYTPIDEREDRDFFDAQRTAANSNDLRGSLLRITPQEDGSYTIPDGNLFTGDDYADEREQGLVREEIYAMGFRNPFTLTVDAQTGEYYIADYGPDSKSWDPERGPLGATEWVRVEEPGFYGWPYFVGTNVPYRDYDFETEESGDPFDPDNPVNESPNNDGITELPAPAQGATIASPFSWEDLIDNAPSWAEEYVPDEVPYETKGTAAPQTGAPMVGDVYRYQDDWDEDDALPESYDGKHLIMFLGGTVRSVTYADDGGVELIEDFPVSFGRAMNMEVAPNGTVYVLEAGGLFEMSAGEAEPIGEPIETPYAMDCGGAHTDETVTIDGLEFDPSPAESQAIDISGNRKLTKDEFWWPDGVLITPNPNSSAPGSGEIENTQHDSLYRTEHWANQLRYTFAVENGVYDVTIHLAEVFHDAPDTRVMSVSVDGETVIDGIDLQEDVGFNTAHVETVEGVEVTDNTLQIEATSSANNPKMSGLEIHQVESYAAEATVQNTGGGTANEPAFTLAPEDHMLTDFGGGSGIDDAEDLSADVYLGYDADHLYLRVEATDDVHESRSGSALWKADSIQWAVGTAGTYGPEYTLSHTADGPVLTRNTDGEAAVDPSAVDVSTSREGTTTTYEAAIPWKALFPEAKGPGEAFPFSILINESDQKGTRDAVLGWSLPGINQEKTVAELGTLTLAGGSQDGGGSEAAGLDPGTTIAVDGRITGWQATAPDAIAGETNPTLRLREGEEYTVAWTNADGAPHDFVLRNAGSEEITGTDIVEGQGETTELTFTAGEIATYVCTLHAGTMVGDVEIV